MEIGKPTSERELAFQGFMDFMKPKGLTKICSDSGEKIGEVS